MNWRSCLVGLLLTVSGLQAAEIVLWAAFEGYLKEQFEQIVTEFNAKNPQDQVVPVFKGNYAATVEQGLAAAEQGNPPHLLQVYEVATQTMVLRPDVYVPVQEILPGFDKDAYIDVVREFYSSSDHRMLALPWNASTGILFYNKDIVDHAPATWEELEQMGLKLSEQGYVGFTTAWPAAYHLEHLCHWHGIPFASCGNGFDGLAARLVFNSPAVVAHWTKLVEWQQKGVFQYGTRDNSAAEALFTSGKAAILLQGANRHAELQRKAPFEVGVGMMPYWEYLVDQPYNLNIGGAAFWVMRGFNDAEYTSVARFLAYLTDPETQWRWHDRTGYLPVSKAALKLANERGTYERFPAAKMAVESVVRGQPTDYTRGIRLGNYMAIRERIIDYLEKALKGELTPQKALDGAVAEGNTLLHTFQKIQGGDND